MTDTGDWARLAAEVRRRREKMRLPIDLVDVGGPTEMTVRKIESGEPASIRPKTKVRLEHALKWLDGLTDRILDGTATEEELNTVAARAGVAEGRGSAGGASANLDGLTASARGRGFTPKREPGAKTVGELLAAAGGMQASSDAVAHALASLGPLHSERLALNAAVEILQPTLDGHGALMRSFLAGMAPQLGGVAAALQSAAGATAATTALAAFADSMRVYESPFRLALGDLARFSTPAIDVTEALGLSNSLRALAIPPPDPEIVALWDEFDQKADAIAAEPWFDEDGDMTIEEVLRRYNEEHPEDDVAAPVHHRREVTDHAGAADAAVASVTGSEVTATADAEDRVEPPLAEVIPGRWSTVFVAQQEVGDVRDLALASELFARVSRRPQSEERTVQLRALNVLIEEFISDQESTDELRSRRR